MESNVWFDDQWADNTIVRHWENFADNTLDISNSERLSELETRWLKTRIEQAYDQFSESKEIAFSQAVLIFPDGRSQPVEATLRIAQGVFSHEGPEAAE